MAIDKGSVMILVPGIWIYPSMGLIPGNSWFLQEQIH